jgi:hypothetical protein
MSSTERPLDAAGRRRSPATLPGYHAGRKPANKGRLYPADPPTVDEIVAVMRQVRDDRHGRRLRALIVVLWRAGLRIQEGLALTESDLDSRRYSVTVRHGKGDRRREVGLDPWAWPDHLRPWLADRVEFPVGPLFCVIDGPTRGRAWSASAVRAELRQHALEAGVRRRFCAPSICRPPGYADASESRVLSRGFRGNAVGITRHRAVTPSCRPGPRSSCGRTPSSLGRPDRPSPESAATRGVAGRSVHDAPAETIAAVCPVALWCRSSIQSASGGAICRLLRRLNRRFAASLDA